MAAGVSVVSSVRGRPCAPIPSRSPQHSLVTSPPCAYPGNTVRILDDERELERRVYIWHVPGPAWNGERVVWEPTPPDGRPELYAQLTALRAERDEQAPNLRARVRSTG
ncbi:hypothetical protein GCM10010345_93830 [Streptomyces canarius]|uniref:Uncharacterized protein n=1 Tax=Streptomyces canarius TaxID=285453 RepID=A0ABQ3DHB9_9ACTN|nr:hypothetical protein GCM10010345_93830 [Streptomyces canarius]